MSPAEITELRPFILSWNLRNTIDENQVINPQEFCITGTHLGEIPIDGWKPYFLEVPKKRFKKDIVGRTHQALEINLKNTTWDRNRVVVLPVYMGSPNTDFEKLKLVIKHWDKICIPDEVPCLAIAFKYRGFYSDNRETQFVSVLIIWNDAVARIISLDWTEGPLEDCVTPEWYIESTSLMNLNDAFEKLKSVYKNISLNNPYFSIYTIPSCLGQSLTGEMKDTT